MMFNRLAPSTALQASRVHSAVQRRQASAWAGARRVRGVRRGSKATTMDDPPTKPLPEQHEVEGEADFSNWVEPHRDTSLTQALTGLGFALGVCYAIFSVSTSSARNSTPAFTRRELPQVAADIPTFAFDNNDPRIKEE
eukprot:Plantae.Rhodophyta-Palmaria_palmata.ctg18261.p1 GENE.Plantae.Rhodophyta-Palmaria_palmata.ctg18261~~Plantae.Rhodophyta-Palmaria_palmata.ctg18261.p1  ORF type:complete len:139 (+),score=16.18 Plantae.Rhodophyta-Palmaria_palmata.ctg18261:41-457(+)